jgi:DNA-binding MarR family transcriptional regulator
VSQRPGDTLDLEKVEFGALSQSPGFLLRMAQLKAFDTFYASLGHLDLKPGEFTVLWMIGLNPGLRQGTIARRLHVKPAHMTKLIQRMVTAGYVTRTIPEDDRRSVRLALTRAGQAFVEQNSDTFLALQLAERSPLNREEADTLIVLLRKFTGIDGAIQ